MNPKHTNPGRPGRAARAPYNFVPLPEKVVVAEGIPSQDKYHADRFTGYIECALTTKSPLYTRTALNPEFFKKWEEDSREIMKNNADRRRYSQFFHLDDAERPVIPGSSLRGMVRTLVEIAGYGKMQWVTNQPMAFRAVGDTTSLGRDYRERLNPLSIQAGYLERRGSDWQIRPAQSMDGKPFARITQDDAPKHGLKKWKDCQNAWHIYVPVMQSKKAETWPLISRASPQSAPGLEQAILIRTGPMQNKKRDFVFGPPDESAETISIPDEAIRIYRNQITEEQRKLLGEEGVLREMQPVFYLATSDRVAFFGHAMMFRLPYKHAPLDLVPEQLRSATDIDLAEAIFGYMPEATHETGRAGRVFFTDAHFESARDGVWLVEEPLTPQVLSGPKPTTFQHYLVQDESEEKGGHNPDERRELAHYGTPIPDETVVRGHKLYWHKEPVSAENIREAEGVNWSNDTQHTQMRPVRAGVIFRFRVYFENLNKVELGALLWAINLPGEGGKEYRHKLGMGKPLGMGAIQIRPALVLGDRQERYSRLLDSETKTWLTAEAPQSENDIKAYVGPFEQFVLDNMNPQERDNATSLKEVERIKMLLKMLEWPGPGPSLTRYMVIKPDNEYKERPVLPDPLNIDRAADTASSRPRRPAGATGKQSRPKPKRRGRR